MRGNKALSDPRSLFPPGTGQLRKPRLAKTIMPKFSKSKKPAGIKLVALMVPKYK